MWGGTRFRVEFLQMRGTEIRSPSRPLRAIGSIASQCLALTTAALVAGFTVDAIVNLQLPSQLVRRVPLHARPSDFVGMALAELPLAFLLGVVSLVAGRVIRALLRFGDARRFSVIVLASALSSLTAVTAHSSDASLRLSTRAWLMIAFASLVVLVISIFLSRFNEHIGPWGMVTTIRMAVPLALALGVATAAHDGRGSRAVSAALFVLCLVLLASWLRGARQSVALRLGLASLPPGLAVLASAYACLQPLSYGGASPAGGSGSDHRPDIVLIVLDTVRADHLKRYGYSRETMPALEKWANDAVTVRRAISTGGWTSPTHASLFSGLTVSQHGVHYGLRTFRTRAFDRISWLPKRLRDNGYQTLAVSSNHLAVPDEVQGFERILMPERTFWAATTFGALAENLFPWAGRFTERMRWRLPYVDAAGIVDLTMGVLSEPANPLFLFVNFMDAHSPYNPPAGSLESLGLSDSNLFSRFLTHRQLTEIWSALPDGKHQELANRYDAELRYLDGELARFLAWIDRKLGDDTIVVVTSDHGEELGEEGRVGHEFGLSQRIVHVPLLIRSRQIEPQRFEPVISLRRVFTFIDRIASSRSASLDDLLDTDGVGVISERYPSKNGYRRSWIALVEERAKIVGPSSEGRQLYRIPASSFSTEEPDSDPVLENRLAAVIDAYWDEYRDRRFLDDEPVTDDELERLRSLGYVR